MGLNFPEVRGQNAAPIVHISQKAVVNASRPRDRSEALIDVLCAEKNILSIPEGKNIVRNPVKEKASWNGKRSIKKAIINLPGKMSKSKTDAIKHKKFALIVYVLLQQIHRQIFALIIAAQSKKNYNNVYTI